MPIYSIDPLAPDPAIINRAAELLRAGELVALPTETVYGLGANGLDAHAVRKIFEAKDRPSFNPLILHVHDVEAAQKLVTAWPATAAALADAFWPGPITFVLPKLGIVPDEVTAGLGSVAIRVPAHPVAQLLLRACNLPVAAPSANRYTEISPTAAQHVAKAFGDELFILDGGPCSVGLESTVIDLTSDVPTLLRPGVLTQAEIEAVIGPTVFAAADPAGHAPRSSPGMVGRHYAPRTPLIILRTDELLARAAAYDSPGVIAISKIDLESSDVIQMAPTAAGYAHELYAALHRLDRSACEVILVEEPPAGSEWRAISDRLRRAATS